MANTPEKKMPNITIREIPIKATGEGNGTPLQYSCLANPVDGGAC